MAPDVKEILTNKEVVAIDQDPLGRPGRRVRKNGDLEVWGRQLADGGRAVILFNRSQSPADVTVNWEDLGYPPHISAKLRDLWQHKDVGSATGKYTANVDGHSVVMLRLMP
jgi:alpha-galactosidase